MPTSYKVVSHRIDLAIEPCSICYRCNIVGFHGLSRNAVASLFIHCACAPAACCSDNVRFAFAASIACGSMSMPMNLRFNCSAAIAVVPAPQNGSKTVWPSSVSPLMICVDSLVPLFPFMQDFIGHSETIESCM